MLFGCLIEKSYHKIGFCEAKGFIHFAFRILHFAFSSSPLNCNLNSDQTSNPAYFSTSSEKMELAQANHSRLKVYSSLASMLSCMK